MARIAGVDLPRDKRVEIGLTYIYGIGRTSATRILTEAGVNPDIWCRLTKREKNRNRSYLYLWYRKTKCRQNPCSGKCKS